jgi:hypothetical protein
VRYYGCRRKKYERFVWWLDMGSAFASALALGVLVLWNEPAVRFFGAGLAGAATLGMAMAPITGWAAKAKRFSILHALYSHLFGQIESVITRIRREDDLSSEATGASEQVQEAYRQMHALDELEPDQDLINREDKKVREAYPENYIWTNL